MTIAIIDYTEGYSQQSVFSPLSPDKMAHAKEVHETALLLKDSVLLAEAYYLFGKIYSFSGDYKSSTDWFLKSLRIQESYGETYELARLHVRLAENKWAQSQPNAAVASIKKAKDMFTRVNSKRGLLKCYMAIADWGSQTPGGNIHFEGQKPVHPIMDSAMYYANKGLTIAQEFNLQVERYYLIVLIGNLFGRQNDPRQFENYRIALKYHELKKDTAKIIRLKQHMATASIRIGKYTDALRLLGQASELYTLFSEKGHYYENRFEALYAELYERTGNPEMALHHLKKSHELQMMLYRADRNGAISRLNFEYDTEKKEAALLLKEKELALRKETLKVQQMSLWAISGLLVVAGSLSILFFRLYRKNQRIGKRNAELLKEQNHRVKNNLQVVSSLLSLQSNRLTDEPAKRAVEESQLRVETMAIIHRRLYDGERLAEVNLHDFMVELTGCILQTFGYDDIQPEYEIDSFFIGADKAVPLGLVLNELITNACKYAFPMHDAPRLSIGCHYRNGIIHFEVRDNGPGLKIEQEKLRTKSSFGLKLIKLQTQQLNGTYKFTMEAGTHFTLNFPIENKYAAYNGHKSYDSNFNQ